MRGRPPYLKSTHSLRGILHQLEGVRALISVTGTYHNVLRGGMECVQQLHFWLNVAECGYTGL